MALKGKAVQALMGIGYHLSLSVVSTLAAMGFFGMYTRPLGIPLVYSGDALSLGALFKATVENGWYERNPALNAPVGQNIHDFPLADNMPFVVARIFGLFTDNWAVVFNLTFLATFPLTAMAAAWFFRTIGLRPTTTFVLALLYTFTPYHFVHSQPHLALSMLFAVALFATLIVRAIDGQPLWGRRPGRWWDPRTWLTWRTAGTLAVLGVVGTTSSYYSVFGLILMSFTVALLLLRRRFASAVGAVAVMGGLIVVMLVNMAPDILYARSLPTSPAAFARQPLDSEIYALKFSSLVFPVPWHRVDALSRFRLNYDGTFPNPGESPALGVVAATGFLALLLFPVLTLLLSRSQHSVETPRRRRLTQLSLLTLVAFFFGTLGGLGTVFALLVSPDIRAWNRIVTFIALFSLGACGLLLEAGLDRAGRALAARRGSWNWSRQRLLVLTACLAVGAVGLYDEAAPPAWTSNTGAEIDQWRQDDDYVRAVEARVPPGTAIFQLPVMQYPESTPIWTMYDYEPIRPYLHSTGLRWSYGGIKGRPDVDWQTVVGTLPTRRLLTALAASGFGGVHLDRNGFANGDPGEVGATLQELLGTPVRSADGRFEFYDMTQFARRVEAAYGERELASIRRHTLRQPVFYWQAGFTGPPVPDAGNLVLVGRDASPSGIIANDGGSLRMRLRFTVLPVGTSTFPVPAKVTWPDGQEQTLSVEAGGTTVSRTFTLSSGQSRLTVEAAAPSVNLLNLDLRDPGLRFPLRGPAASDAGR